MTTSCAKPNCPGVDKGRMLGRGLCVSLLFLHGMLALDVISKHNLTGDEGGHVFSGLIAWEYGKVDVYAVNPPLIKLLTALPLSLGKFRLPDDMRYTPPIYWHDQEKHFLQANRTGLQALTLSARFPVVALSILGGFLVFRWSSLLFGMTAGLVGLTLWVFSPNVLSWAGIATVDLGATVLSLATVYTLRHYLHHPGWLTASWTGFVLGLAVLTKFTLLIFYPFCLFIWLLAWRQNRNAPHQPGAVTCWLHCVLVIVLSVLVIYMGYGFQGIGRRLGSFPFCCHALTYDDNGRRINRFRHTYFEQLPVPLPAAFITGLDLQKSDADAGLPAYLHGKWQRGGWWYYYLYGLGVKMPLGTLTLIALCGALLLFGSRYRRCVSEELLIWLPILAILLLISSQTGINSHLRYVLPIFPFIFIGISRVGLLLADGGYRRRQEYSLLPMLGAVLVVVALGSNVYAATRIHPHYLSYFNELAGGPDNGWRHLLESNIDWGQDLLFFKRWVEKHPEAHPLYLAYYGGIAPNLLELDYRLPPFRDSPEMKELQPGWYAVSVNLVCGMSFRGYDQYGRNIPFPSGAFTYFRKFAPVAKAGYSIFIYHITAEDTDRIRAWCDQS